MNKTIFNGRIFMSSAVVLSVALLSLALFCGCSPTSSSSSDEAKDSESKVQTADFTWSESSDCSMCHRVESDSMTDTACEMYAGHSDVPCISCHTDANGLESAHANVTLGDTEAPSKLRKTSVAKEACLSCHDLASVAEATAGLTVLTDAKGTVVNPHALPENDSHAEIDCSSCHKMHSDSSPLTDAPDVCLGCHHQNVYECNTCHS